MRTTLRQLVSFFRRLSGIEVVETNGTHIVSSEREDLGAPADDPCD